MIWVVVGPAGSVALSLTKNQDWRFALLPRFGRDGIKGTPVFVPRYIHPKPCKGTSQSLHPAAVLVKQVILENHMLADLEI